MSTSSRLLECERIEPLITLSTLCLWWWLRRWGWWLLGFTHLAQFLFLCLLFKVWYMGLIKHPLDIIKMYLYLKIQTSKWLEIWHCCYSKYRVSRKVITRLKIDQIFMVLKNVILLNQSSYKSKFPKMEICKVSIFPK